MEWWRVRGVWSGVVEGERGVWWRVREVCGGG